MKFFFDTETSGFYKSDLPFTHPEQPHVVEIAGLLMNDDGVEVSSFDFIIRPTGWKIPDQAAAVHKITTERALAEGVPLQLAMAAYANLRALADEQIAHNSAFDEGIVNVAFKRDLGRDPTHPGPTTRSCTMLLASPILKLPPSAKMRAAGFHKNKPPNFGECIKFFFGEELTGAHNALVDTRACARVYWAAKKWLAENVA